MLAQGPLTLGERDAAGTGDSAQPRKLPAGVLNVQAPSFVPRMA